MNKALCIMHLHPQVVNGVDFIVQDDNDGKGQYIAVWNIDAPQPTDDEYQSVWNRIKDKPAPKSELELVKEENADLNLKVIDLWETLLSAGVL